MVDRVVPGSGFIGVYHVLAAVVVLIVMASGVLVALRRSPETALAMSAASNQPD